MKIRCGVPAILLLAVGAVAATGCDQCRFDGSDGDDCKVYGQLGDRVLIPWYKASQQCLDVFNIKDEAISPSLLESIFPNPDGTGASANGFTNYLRFNGGSVVNGLRAGFAQFFVESDTMPGVVELKDTVTVNGVSYDCEASSSTCWTQIRKYFSEDPGATGMAGVGRTLYCQQAFSREKEQSFARIPLCSDGATSECGDLSDQVRQIMANNEALYGLGPANQEIPGCGQNFTSGECYEYQGTSSGFSRLPRLGMVIVLAIFVHVILS